MDFTTVYNQVFDRKVANKELAKYKRKGVSKSTKKLIDSIINNQMGSLENKTLLDIGSGIGIIGMELVKKGTKITTCVEISDQYLAVTKKEVTNRGLLDRFKFIKGDAVIKAGECETADIVTLDKTICCYEDFKSLIKSSVAKAKHLYGIVVPREVWWVKMFNRTGNLFWKMKGSSFRTFIHPVDQIKNTISENGFRLVSLDTAREWLILVYEVKG